MGEIIKNNAFTLIEILVASTIFVMVVTTSLSAFAMVKNSNYRSDDVRVAQSCARQARDYISDFIRSSNPSGIRVMGITEISTGKYKLSQATEQGGSIDNYLGVAVFEESESFKIIYKVMLANGSYSFKKSSENINVVSRNEYEFASNDELIMPSECGALPETLGGNEKPFLLYLEEHSPDYDQTNQSDKIYVVNISDLIYRLKDSSGFDLSQSDASEKKSFASLRFTVTNSARSLW